MNRKYFFLFILCFICLLYACVYYVNPLPMITSIHVINLDRDVERWKSIQSQAIKLGLSVQRFSAIYGKDIPYKSMRSLGVGNTTVRADRHDREGKNMHNLGVVGCFLSHRALLAHLLKQNVPDSCGHLILEDDVQFPSDFLQPGGRWDILRRYIPSDWDIISLRMWYPHGKTIAPGIMKLSATNSRENLGAFAYVVRHGALQKILTWLTYMYDAYDDHLNIKFNDWNVYLLEPGIIEVNDDFGSSINKINVPS